MIYVNDIDNIKNLIFKNNYKKQICLPVSIEMAIEAKKIGVKVIVMTNLTYSKEVTSRHTSGKLLYEVGDLVI